MSFEKEPSFGASIVVPKEVEADSKAATNPPHPTLRPAVSNNSLASTDPPTPRPELEHDEQANPFASASHLGVPGASKGRGAGAGIYKHDLESGLSAATNSSAAVRDASGKGNAECTMWPSKATLREKELREKRARRWCRWNPMDGLSKRQKLWVKVLIALFIVAAAVGLGIGISKAVGGGVWAGKGQTSQIPDPHR